MTLWEHPIFLVFMRIQGIFKNSVYFTKSIIFCRVFIILRTLLSGKAAGFLSCGYFLEILIGLLTEFLAIVHQ